MQWDAVMRVLAALEAAAVEYVLIGGVAVNFHGLVRATEDIDLFIAPEAENADLEHERYDVDGQVVAVATPATLYKMKKATVRPLDHADAARLAEAFGLDKDPSCQ